MDEDAASDISLTEELDHDDLEDEIEDDIDEEADEEEAEVEVDDKEEKEDDEVEEVDEEAEVEEVIEPKKKSKVADTNTQYTVAPKDRITSNRLSKYEFSMLCGVLSQKIADNEYTLVDYGNLTNPDDIAYKAIMDNRCPFVLKRHIGLEKYEDCDPNIMVKPII